MGCWNSTCAISGLPIMYHDRVKLIFIWASHVVPKPGSNNPISPSSPDDTWSAISLVVSGKYNDYGSIEDIEESIFVDAALQVFQNKKQSGSLKVEVDKYETNSDFNTMEEFIDMVERGRVSVKNLYKQKDDPEFAQLAFCMIKEDIWNTILKSYKRETWLAPLVYPTHDKFAHKVALLSSLKYVQMSLRDDIKFPDKPSATKFYHHEADEMLDKKFLTDPDKYALQLAKQNEIWTIYDAMYALRRAFAPPTGGGSQDSNYELHAALATTVLDICYKAISGEEDD